MLAIPLWLALAQIQVGGTSPAGAAQPPPSTILVVDLTAGSEVRQELVRALSDQVTIQVRQLNPNARVLGTADIRSMMTLEAERARLNCQAVSCLAEIGGALGAKEVVNGSLARVGSREVLTLKRVLSRDVKVLADTTSTVPVGHEDDLLEAVKGAARRLYPSTETADSLFAESEEAPSGRSHVGGILLGVGALLAVGTAVAGAVIYANNNSTLNTLRGQTAAPNASDIVSAQSWATTGTGLGIAGAIAAAALGTGAVLAW